MKNVMKDVFLKLMFNNMENYMRSGGAQRQKMCREKEAQIFRKKREVQVSRNRKVVENVEGQEKMQRGTD